MIDKSFLVEVYIKVILSSSSEIQQVVSKIQLGLIWLIRYFSYICLFSRLVPLIKQTLVVICEGGRCVGDTCTAGEVITLAAGTVC